MCVCEWVYVCEKERERKSLPQTGNSSHNYRGWDDPRPAVGKLGAQDGQ